MVPSPQVSDIPQSSPIGMPIAWKNSRTSSGVGAAPTLTASASSRPSCVRSAEKSCSSACAAASATSGGTSSPACSARTFASEASSPFSAGMRCSSGRLASIASRPALSFSKIRGTAKNHVGLTLGRYSAILRGSAQMCTERPLVIGR